MRQLLLSFFMLFGLQINSINIYAQVAHFTDDQATTELNNSDWVATNVRGPLLAVNIDAVDSTTAWLTIPGFFGEAAVLRTTDGGNSFTQHDFPSPFSQWPFVIYAQDSLTAFVGTWSRTQNETALVLKTTNAGITWDTVGFNRPIKMETVAGIHFYDKQHGFALLNEDANNDGLANRMVFFQTTDSGNTWVENDSFPTEIGDLQYLYNNNSCYEVKDQYIWIGLVTGKILRSRDGGNTWESLSWVSDDLTSIAFKDTLNGIAINSGTIRDHGVNGDSTLRKGFVTADGGNTWEEISIPNDMETIEYVPQSNGVYIGTEGWTAKSFYYISKDNGQHWEERPADFLMDVDFIDNTTGWGTDGFGAVKWNGGVLEAEAYEEIVHSIPYVENFENGLPPQYELGGNYDLTSNSFRREEFQNLGVFRDNEFVGIPTSMPWWSFSTMETAAIQLPEDHSCTLSFDAYFRNIDSPTEDERAFVTISMDNKNTWSMLYDLEDINGAEWLPHSVDLAAYKGKKIHLAFNYADPSLGRAFGFFVDDITVVESMTSSNENVFSQINQVEVYPNPFRNELYINLENLQDADLSIQLFDVNGKLWLERKVPEISRHHIGFLSEGFYLLRITDASHQVTLKLIKI